MKRSTKLTLAGGFLTFVAILSTSCTSNFCSNKEKSRILFAIEPGVSEYFASEQEAKGEEQAEGYTYTFEQVYEGNDNLWRRVEVDKDGKYTKSNQLSTIITTCANKYYVVPSIEYLTTLDTELLTMCLDNYEDESHVKYTTKTVTKDIANKALTQYGYLKFYGENDTMWGNFDTFNSIVSYIVGPELCPSVDFISYYKTTLNTTISSTKSCIAVKTDDYGAYGQDKISVTMEQKDWAYAWSKGPISGLIVYPVSWLIDSITSAIAGGTSPIQLAEGWKQLLALVIVTIIVRTFIFLVTFKSTLSQQKMQALQPELAKIQAKYPNSNTSQSEKQRLAEEQMRLYKKHKINPLGQILVLIIQFPIFIGVWGAMTGSAVLSSGAFLNLNLSTSIWDALKNTNGLPSNTNGWWTALILFILMAVSQFLSMKIPQWIQKSRTKKISRLGVNPAQKSQNKTMTIISYGMLIMIIFMGFTLPAAMGVYWLVGALFSLAQSLITQAIIGH